MPLLLVVLLLSLASATVADARTREVPLAVCTKDGSPVDDLTLAEIEIKEDGKQRTLLGIRPDERPVDIALILDSSQWMDDQYRTELVPAGMEFWQSLPPKARLTIWTSGGRAHRAVDFGVEPEAAKIILQKAATGSPLFTLEAIIAACDQLRQEQAERRVMVVVTGARMPLSQTLLDRSFQALADARVTPMIVLAKGYTGTAGGMRLGGLSRVAAGISSQYLVRFESDAEKPKRPEVKVKRKGVQARAGLALIAR